MTPTLIVQPEAEADLAEAFGWYEGCRVGLGHEFLDEVSRAYVARVDRVFVLAILHQRRSPRLARTRAHNFKAE